MLVPARGSAPLRGCFRKRLTDSSLRVRSGLPERARSALSGLVYQKRKITQLLPELQRQHSIVRRRNVRGLSA
jgi:hypothetical protein